MATLVREIKYFPLEGVLRVTFDSYTFSSYVDEPVEANFFVLHGIDHSGQETGEIVGFEYDLCKLERDIEEIRKLDLPRLDYPPAGIRDGTVEDLLRWAYKKYIGEPLPQVAVELRHIP